MYNAFDFKSFVEGIKDKRFYEIIDEIDRCETSASRASYIVKGSRKNREMGSQDYISKLKALRHFLVHEVLPKEFDYDEIQLIISLCRNLVSKGEMKPELLDKIKL